jgi:plasmid stabilization system protein ParE
VAGRVGRTGRDRGPRVPRVILAAGAVRGLERCRTFLAGASPEAAAKASRTIALCLARLSHSPEIGRPMADAPRLRELVIPFGGAGYVALYRHDPSEDAVHVVAFRHQKEAGYL